MNSLYKVTDKQKKIQLGPTHNLYFVNTQLREQVWFNTSALDTGCCFKIIFSFYKFLM